MYSLNQIKSEFKSSPIFTAIVIIAFIITWSTLYMNTMFDIDIGWLLQCLERFIAGGTYDKDFYETNPPLSFLIYLPAYLLYNYISIIPPHIAILATFIGYIALSNFTLYKMLKTLDYDLNNIIIIISGCLIIESWGAGISYGSKDHLIFIFLTPLCLLQYLITLNKKPSVIISALTILMGAIAICLKPHYALIPAIFFLHRLIHTRSLIKCVASWDFIALLLIGGSYIGFIYISAPEYINVILPTTISIYSIEQPFPLTMRLTYIIFILPAIALAFFLPRDSANIQIRHSVFICAALGILNIIPYCLQFKGYNYHALPFLSFSLLALFLSVTAIAKKLFKHNNYAIIIACTVIALISLPFTTGGKNKNISSQQFLATPLINAIDDLAWNRVFASYDFKYMLSPLPYISDLKNGSRFAQSWHLNGLYLIYSKAENEETQDKIMAQMINHVDLIAEDMVRYKPSVITIPQYRNPDTNIAQQNFLKFLLKNYKFKKNMDNYTFEKTIKFNSSLTVNNYDPDKIELHDLYILKKDHKL